MVGRRGVSRRTARRTTRRVSRRQAALGRAFSSSDSREQTPTKADAAGDEGDRYTRLRQAKELLDAGILSQEEFEAEKAKILGA